MRFHKIAHLTQGIIPAFDVTFKVLPSEDIIF